MNDDSDLPRETVYLTSHSPTPRNFLLNSKWVVRRPGRDGSYGEKRDWVYYTNYRQWDVSPGGPFR